MPLASSKSKIVINVNVPGKRLSSSGSSLQRELLVQVKRRTQIPFIADRYMRIATKSSVLTICCRAGVLGNRLNLHCTKGIRDELPVTFSY